MCSPPLLPTRQNKAETQDGDEHEISHQGSERVNSKPMGDVTMSPSIFMYSQQICHLEARNTSSLLVFFFVREKVIWQAPKSARFPSIWEGVHSKTFTTKVQHLKQTNQTLSTLTAVTASISFTSSSATFERISPPSLPALTERLK